MLKCVNSGTKSLRATAPLTNSNATYGAGIYNAGTLNLKSDLKINTPYYMNFNLKISDNIATDSGGGIYNSGTLTYSGDAYWMSNKNGGINSNTATAGHGGGIYNSGSLSINSGAGGPSFDIGNGTSPANGGNTAGGSGGVGSGSGYAGGNGVTAIATASGTCSSPVA